MKRCSDKRLKRLVRMALLAIEDPDKGIVFDDFDLRYREAERKREADAARWFYRDKTSFETKYDEDCGEEGNNEPSWVSDEGRGSYEHYEVLAAVFDRQRNPSWLVFWRRKRLELSRKRRAVHDALAVDWRTACAAKIAAVSRPTVDLCKKIFKTHFAQCHTAWKRDFVF